MNRLQAEQKSFQGTAEEVLGKVFAYIEEAKCVLESEVLRGLGFGLITYHFNNEGGDVVVLRSSKTVRDLDLQLSPPPVFSNELEAWNRSLNILKDWKYVQPSSLVYGWKCKLAFDFSHSLAIPTMPADDLGVDPDGVVECLIFKSVMPQTLPFIFLDGALAANTVCLLQAAPEEKQLYLSMKDRAEHEQPIKMHFVKAMLTSKRPLILLKGLKHLHQMKCPEGFLETAIDTCCENLWAKNGKLLQVMQETLSTRADLAFKGGHLMEKLAAVNQRSLC